jgi:LysM repeat protein
MCIYASAQRFQASPVTVSSFYDVENGKYYRVHVVEKGHTLYSIAKAYKCIISDIIKSSPQGDNTVSIGEPLLIPLFDRKNLSSLVRYNVADTLAKRSAITEQPLTPAEKHDTLQYISPERKDVINVSLMLPLYTDEPSFPKKQYYFLPILEGALLAIEDIDNDTGSKINLNVFDLTENESSWNLVKNNPKFLQSDLILCAAYKNIFPRIDSLSRKNHIPLVHLHSERDSVSHGNPYFIQLLPSISTQIEVLADTLIAYFHNGNFVIFDEEKTTVDGLKMARYLHSLLEKAKKEHKFEPLNIHLYDPNEAGYEKFSTLLDKKHVNVVCGFTHKEIRLANMFVPLLKNNPDKENGMLMNDYYISLFGPATWAYFTKIDPELFRHTSFTYFNTFATRLDPAASKVFEKDFFDRYGTLPDGMAYKGYMFSKWIFAALQKYNTDFIRHLDECNSYPVLGAKFDFKFDAKTGGFENKSIEFVRFFSE